MRDSQLEELQERVGERLGFILMIVGLSAVILTVYYLSANDWGYNVHTTTYIGIDTYVEKEYLGFSSWGVGCVIVIIIGAVAFSYGAWRYVSFRMSPVYPKYVTSKRADRLARIEAKRQARLSMTKAQDRQPQPLFREREVVRTEVVMIKCTYCGNLNPQGSQKCSSCGARV